MKTASNKLLVFGANGAIGTAILAAAVERGWDVVAAARAPHNEPVGAQWIQVDLKEQDFSHEGLEAFGPYTGVCWAQGANANDSVYDVDLQKNRDLYESNCLYVLATLKVLLSHNLLERPARLCVISSIWQNLARQNKLSYCMTKAALQGLVLSASADLAVDGHLMNAVLPGALDTPMTRRNLDTAQLNTLTSATRFQRLPALGDVTSLVLFLCSTENTGITGQFIAADLGFSNVRLL
ncbi:MAG: SDR family oxidoreductase [Terracidiphilus sp.]|jgi:NAD(P)-dependent dehydrogenase (short-subunit alcohol dehydrogenase family)